MSTENNEYQVETPYAMKQAEQSVDSSKSSGKYEVEKPYKFKDKPADKVTTSGVQGYTKKGKKLYLPNKSVYAQQELLSRLGVTIGVSAVEDICSSDNPMAVMSLAIMRSSEHEKLVHLMHDVICDVRIEGEEKLSQENIDQVLGGNLGYAIELFCWTVRALFSNLFTYVLEKED